MFAMICLSQKLNSEPKYYANRYYGCMYFCHQSDIMTGTRTRWDGRPFTRTPYVFGNWVISAHRTNPTAYWGLGNCRRYISNLWHSTDHWEDDNQFNLCVAENCSSVVKYNEYTSIPMYINNNNLCTKCGLDIQPQGIQLYLVVSAAKTE